MFFLQIFCETETGILYLVRATDEKQGRRNLEAHLKRPANKEEFQFKGIFNNIPATMIDITKYQVVYVEI